MCAVQTITKRSADKMDAKLKKSLSGVELADLVRIIEAQETDIKLIEIDFDERLERILMALL